MTAGETARVVVAAIGLAIMTVAMVVMGLQHPRDARIAKCQRTVSTLEEHNCFEGGTDGRR